MHRVANIHNVTLLALLDLNAAFDCVNHILLMRLQRIVGLSGQVLSWIRSFLTERSPRVAYAGSLSSLIVWLWGVPQGSVLGPLLFLLYTAELFDIIVSHGASAHFCADDVELDEIFSTRWRLTRTTQSTAFRLVWQLLSSG